MTFHYVKGLTMLESCHWGSHNYKLHLPATRAFPYVTFFFRPALLYNSHLVPLVRSQMQVQSYAV